jgi:integrase
MPPVREGQVFKLKTGAWAYRIHRGAGGQVGGFATKGAAREALNARLGRERLGVDYRPRLTFTELVDEFFAQYVAEEKSKKTLREWLVRARAQFDDLPIERLDARTISAWRATLPPRSAQKYHRALRQVLNYAVRVDLLDRNPAADVPNPEPPREEIVPFESWADVERVAGELEDLFRPIPVFATGTGLRPEEWIPLRLGDVDLRERAVSVLRVYSSGVLRPAPLKGKGARRRVPLRARVIEGLAESGRLGPGKDPDALLFPSWKGGLIDLHAWREREWYAATEAAGVAPKRTPYGMRHTYAAWSLAAGVNIFTLAKRMGTSVDLIDKTYGHFARNAEEQERELLDAFDARLDDDEAREETA